jgi:hypothetical protein
MASIHPQDRSAPFRHARGELHPVFGLLVGFGVITAGATAVHVLFNVVF